MFCPQCGKKTEEDDLFCGSCGKQLRAVFVPLRQPGSQQTAPKPQQNTAPKPEPAAFPRAGFASTPKPAPGPRGVSSSFPRAGFASSSKPESKPAPAAPKPEPKPAPVTAFKPAPQTAPQPAPQPAAQPAPAAFKPAPQPEPKVEKTAVPQPEPQPAPVVIAKPEPKAVPKTQQLITTPQPGNLPKDTCYDADGKLTWFYRDLEKDPAGNFVIKFVFEEDHIANYEGIDITSQAMADAQVSIRYYYKRVTVVERHAETGWIFFRHGIDRYFLKVSSDQMEFILDEFMKRCPSSKFGVVKQW